MAARVDDAAGQLMEKFEDFLIWLLPAGEPFRESVICDGGNEAGAFRTTGVENENRH